jgi:SAM-dependent methyltransferase
LYDGLTDRTYLRAPGRWQLVRCGSCSSAYLDPRPSEKTVHLAYGDYYEGPSGRRAPDEESSWRQLRRALRNGYLNATYGYRLAPASRLGRYVVPLLPHQREQADEVVRHLPAPSGEARLLDIGCGEGEFLATMKSLGWTAIGVEPSEGGAAIARSQGVRVEQGTLAEASLEEEFFDAVTFRLVFEALADPVQALEACRRALKPSGILWLASPSLDSEGHRRFGPNWIFLDVPRHAVVFPPSSLARLLVNSGFDVVDLRPSPHAPWSFRLSSAIAHGLPPFRKPPPLSRRQRLQARLADVKALRRPELSDVVVIVARKR